MDNSDQNREIEESIRKARERLDSQFEKLDLESRRGRKESEADEAGRAAAIAMVEQYRAELARAGIPVESFLLTARQGANPNHLQQSILESLAPYRKRIASDESADERRRQARMTLETFLPRMRKVGLSQAYIDMLIHDGATAEEVERIIITHEQHATTDNEIALSERDRIARCRALITSKADLLRKNDVGILPLEWLALHEKYSPEQLQVEIDRRLGDVHKE